MKDISKILKSDIKTEDLKQENGILCCMNDLFISGDNQKYMKMYDWMSFFYDFGEKWIGKLKYGNAIDRLRTELMSRLEWKNNISVLYVSIGTGADLRYIDLNAIEQCIPASVTEKKTELFWDNKFYSITFRKPM